MRIGGIIEARSSVEIIQHLETHLHVVDVPQIFVKYYRIISLLPAFTDHGGTPDLQPGRHPAGVEGPVVGDLWGSGH